MNIALIGYGKMGRAIEIIARQKNHKIVLTITSANADYFTAENLGKADVAIEFTNPGSAASNIISCLRAGIPVISGSTGWLAEYDSVSGVCKETNGTLLYASNFSIGVNIFFELNKKLAALMKDQDYSVMIEEIHHTQKKDAPSGTAITLAEQIMTESPVKKEWVNRVSSDPAQLSIVSRRIDPAPGTHYVRYSSPMDEIEIIHNANSRQGFALGAVMAAEFVSDKKGIFNMADVLQL
ncbi:MAG: 4-hydroxy-tetrahydrodipicolinate reductase [Ferruginibacter sp.]